MKNFISITVFILSAIATTSGQDAFFTDTIRIREILVRGAGNENILAGFRQVKADSESLVEKRMLSLSDLVSEAVPVFIKTYSPGGLSSVSLHGTMAVHTQVAWNGVVINSPMLGQTDLSIVPAGFIDEMSVEYGSMTMKKTSGAFGGLINIGTKAQWDKGLRLSVTSGAGNFGLWSGSLKAETGGTSFQSVTRILARGAENDFRYLNYAEYATPVWERRRNSESELKALMQEFFLRGNNSVTSASLWLQSSERNLPPALLSTGPPAGESQTDKFIRAIIKHSKYYTGSTLEITSGAFLDLLDYSNRQASINSLNRSATFFLRNSWELNLPRNLKLNFVFSEDYNLVKSVNYAGRKSRNLFSIAGIARKTISGKTGFTLLLKETVSGTKMLSPDYSAGIDLYLTDNNTIWIKADYSGNSRLPSLNDLYWNPGGNPEIRNEYCRAGQVTLGTKSGSGSSLNASAEISVYNKRIRNMIQWLPGEFSYWSPVNAFSVNINGAEALLSIKSKLGKLKYSFSGNYTLNHSVYGHESDEKKGKHLIYIPDQQGGVTIKISRSFLYFSSGISYTGKRYTTVDNDTYLKGVFLADAEAGIKIEKLKNSIDLKFSAENILNNSYELIAYYPMPGRWFRFTVNYRFVR